LLVDQARAAAAQMLKGSGQVQIISHLDADGICCAAILSKALSRADISHQISIIPQMDKSQIAQLAKTSNARILFSDVGSSHADMIQKKLGSDVIVLDHHRPTAKGDFMHVNPHFHGMDGGTEISGAGVCYLFAKAMNKANSDLAHMAVIGAIGDSQEKTGLISINKKILDEAINGGLIEISQGLRFFGASTKPLFKALGHNYDPFIPGVSGSCESSKKFLSDLGFEEHARLRDLDDTQMKKLVNAIIRKRENEKNPEDIYGTKYKMTGYKYPFDDAREFSTILNACGRLGKALIGVSALLGNRSDQKTAERIVSEYRKEIVDALQWYREGEGVIIADGYIIADARGHVKATIAGTLASMLARSGELNPGTMVMVMAKTKNRAKISVRVAGRVPPAKIDARIVLAEIVKQAGGEYGGHRTAAGALISINKSDEFLRVSKKVMKKYSMKEIV